MDIHMGHFRDKGEEIEYLQQAVRQLQSQLDDSRQLVWQLNSESEEFRESSWQLEKELENSLDQAEKKNRDLRHQCNKLGKDTDVLKDKMEEIKRINDTLSSDLKKYKQMEIEWTKRIQQLEQQNDDLERALRAASDHKMTAQQHLDEAMERDVLREGEKEELLSLLQQLQEENKDLAEEIRIRDRLSSFEKSPRDLRESRTSVETQTQVVHAVQPLRNKITKKTLYNRE
ncbi:hypothetical protein R5R35_003823 [Gryllus longicercus]|uniref:Uncharacterized protein n=1 Tax=Gryllus longicercus TaxID=2509291 RepID=A0AAN9VDU8_9ORTH